MYGSKNEQLPNFFIVTCQIPTCEAPKPFVVWLSIQCHGASKKVEKVKTGP